MNVKNSLEKADLKHGDKVTVEYGGKVFLGVIDLESNPLPVSPGNTTGSPGKVTGSPHPPNERQGPRTDETSPDEQPYTPRKGRSVAVSCLVEEPDFTAPPAAKKNRKKSVAKKSG